ncbi:GNAT family N-acetyltransferase [Leifsonia sp. NPDC058230]|uniref:GNAT family N-acetyltransferase n=1 Tax=Leifsonia sp. NPDC058230 TaxID=3346391 RepID=UPI0036DB3DC3
MNELTGDCVFLRPWRSEDAAFVYDLYSRWAVQRYIGREPKVMEDPEQAHALIRRLRSTEDPTLGYWAVEAVATGELVGTVMLQGIRLSGTQGPSDEIEIGWHFHPDAWGHGYATAAAKLVLQHGFESGLDRIIAVAHPENLASHRICLRLGMTDEGPTTRYYDTECELFTAAPPHVPNRG